MAIVRGCELPDDLLYDVANNMWYRENPDGTVTLGMTMVATGMAGLRDSEGLPMIGPHEIEAVLNHVSGSRAGVAGIYNRHAYYAEKKRALQLWEDHVCDVEKQIPLQ